MDGLAIQARGLTKRYGPVACVNGLDLDVPKGSVFGFLGPNGAGKTTTMRMLLGLIRPSAGGATVMGFDVVTQRSGVAACVGAIVETPAFYKHLSALESLRVVALSGGVDPARGRLDEVLAQVGLSGLGGQRVGSFSLGMKQRLGLACALINKPAVLMLDEPTNGLDPAGTVEMRKLIQDLGTQGHTVFVSSHLLAEVEAMCSHVVIIQKGVRRLEGRMAELLAQQGGMFHIKVDNAASAVTALAAFKALSPAARDGVHLEVRAAEADIPDVVAALVGARVRVYAVQAHKDTLEALFLRLTEGA